MCRWRWPTRWSGGAGGGRGRLRGVGGGSAMGKAIALRTELPLIAVPSTYSAPR